MRHDIQFAHNALGKVLVVRVVGTVDQADGHQRLGKFRRWVSAGEASAIHEVIEERRSHSDVEAQGKQVAPAGVTIECAAKHAFYSTCNVYIRKAEYRAPILVSVARAFRPN